MLSNHVINVLPFDPYKVISLLASVMYSYDGQSFFPMLWCGYVCNIVLNGKKEEIVLT